MIRIQKQFQKSNLNILILTKNRLYETASLQYEGRIPQVQVVGFIRRASLPRARLCRLASPRNYMPIHDVAPSAVTMAVATDAMICTMNLMVSLFVMVLIN